MVVHRRGCDSWKVHYERLHSEGGPVPVPVPEQEIVKWHCPHENCPAFAHTFHDLVKHLEYCPEVLKSTGTACQEVDLGLGDVSTDLDNLSAFEAWCRDHGRAA